MSLALVIMLAGGMLAAAPPAATPDPAVAPAEPDCAPDPASAEAAVRAIFGELVRIHRNVLPGPQGKTLLAQQVDRIVENSVDVAMFTRGSLGPAWNEVDEVTRERWQATMGSMLYVRYRQNLDEPQRARMSFGEPVATCERASVPASITGPGGGEPAHVVFGLVRRGRSWRLYDVSINGTSLLRTWRRRLLRFYEEGGVAAVDEQMQILAGRYSCTANMCRPPHVSVP